MSFSYKENTSRGEIPSINLMRGIASLMVCFFHLSFGDNDFLPEHNTVRVVTHWGWMGVQVFFIISGFVIPYAMYLKNYSIANMGSFLKKRMIRIEPPYLISIVLVLVLGYISSRMPFYRGKPFDLDWGNIAGHVAYLNVFTGAKWIQAVYWTLAVEFQYYILIALAYKLIVSKNIYFRVLFFILFMASLSLKASMPFFIFSFATYFMMGILLFQYYCRISSSVEFWVLLIVTTIAAYHFEGPVLTILSIVTIAMIGLIKKVHPVFIFLGTISYSLYLVHIPIGGRFMSITIRYFKDSVHAKEALVFAGAGFSVLMAYLYYILVEKRFKVMAAKVSYGVKKKPLE